MYLITLIDIIMIDSIILWLKADEITGMNVMEELPQKLSNISTTIDKNTNNIIIKGYLSSLFVLISENGVYISGSLSKYYYGNNMYTLSFTEIKQAFKMIENQLNIPIEKAKVQRLDIAENFIVDYPAENYWQCLGDMTYYNRQEMNNGVYYNGSNKTLSFYDKGYERKVKKKGVPECYIGKNVLRYELRFMKRLGKQFDRQFLYVSDLILESFFAELLDKYKMQYEKIHKYQSIIHYSDLLINDLAQFRNQIKLLGMQALGGEAALLNTVNQARKDKAFKNNMHATRVIQDIKKTYQSNVFTESHSLVRELETIIATKVEGYLE